MINVVEYDDKLVFSNKGNFIPQSVKQVLAMDAPEERYRNRFLAQAMVELKMVDMNYSTLLAKNPDLTINDVEILSRVLMKRNVSSPKIERLRKLKLVEGKMPNIFISKTVAQSVGKKISYTKLKALMTSITRI